MKNLFKLTALVFVLFLGMNTMHAQTLTQTDQDRPEVVAKAIAEKLTSELGLNGDQQRALFRAYTANESNYRKYVNGQDPKDAAVIANKKKYDDVLKENVKKALTDAQYKKWLSLQKM
ncbi:MAG: hypothetical protein K8F54_05310 [Altibacter sp.]|uniref:hypothetical protein n=1 Tax=Altibacter sp. TaxID=2024823 RepID=UPI001E15FB37|nr:hypothetical protein [Altibacter sp.]MBZ0327002.1 hypothetical protein [Altibacter sp.]